MAQADDASVGAEAVAFAAPGESAPGKAGDPKEETEQVAERVVPEIVRDFGIAHHAASDDQRLDPAIDEAPGEECAGERPVAPGGGGSKTEQREGRGDWRSRRRRGRRGERMPETKFARPTSELPAADRPERAERVLTEKAPKPRNSTRSPRAIAETISPRMALSTFSTSR